MKCIKGWLQCTGRGGGDVLQSDMPQPVIPKLLLNTNNINISISSFLISLFLPSFLPSFFLSFLHLLCSLRSEEMKLMCVGVYVWLWAWVLSLYVWLREGILYIRNDSRLTFFLFRWMGVLVGGGGQGLNGCDFLKWAWMRKLDEWVCWVNSKWVMLGVGWVTVGVDGCGWVCLLYGRGWVNWMNGVYWISFGVESE